MGIELLNKIKVELENIAQVDQDPSLEGRQLLINSISFKKEKLIQNKILLWDINLKHTQGLLKGLKERVLL